MIGKPRTPSEGDIQAYLALASALASLGILPRPWQKTLGTLSSIVWLASRL